MEPEGSLPRWQKPATWSYHQTDDVVPKDQSRFEAYVSVS